MLFRFIKMCTSAYMYLVVFCLLLLSMFVISIPVLVSIKVKFIHCWLALICFAPVDERKDEKNRTHMRYLLCGPFWNWLWLVLLMFSFLIWHFLFPSYLDSVFCCCNLLYFCRYPDSIWAKLFLFSVQTEILCQNNVQLSQKEFTLSLSFSLSLSVLFTFRDVIDRNLFHEVSTQKHLLNDFKDCRCASVVSISDMFISFWLLLHTRTRTRTQSKKYNHFRWLMTRASFIGVTWRCCQVVKIDSMCEYCV